MNIQDIIDIRISSFTKGRFNKKEDFIIEIRSLGQDRRLYVTRIDVDDKYADEIIREVKLSKQLESNSIYWTHRSLTFTTQYGQKNTVDIYPLTPFLASGEEILWQSLKADINDKDKKVNWIDAITNYRIFHFLSCSKCGHTNLDGSNFCNNCGSPLSPSCTKCGHSNPPGALFCGKCGSKLGAAAKISTTPSPDSESTTSGVEI
jgi:ribosomal protein L40E